MTGEILYEQPYCKIFFLKEKNILVTELIGVFNITQYKDIFDNTLKEVLKTEASGLILDQTQSKGGNLDSRLWLTMDWMPQLKSKISNPKFRIAGINNVKVGFKKFIADYVEHAAKKLLPFPIKSCVTLEEAITWLS